MRKASSASFLGKKGLQQIVIVALIYWFFLGLTKYSQMFLPGIEIRIAGFMPVVSGMLLGLPGAIGSGLGNFLGDLGGSDTLPARCFGMLANFFMAYLPYRLWYGLKKENPSMLIYNQHSFLAFVTCLFIAEFNVTTFLTIVVDYFYDPAEIAMLFVGILSNDYAFPVLIALPLLIYLKGNNVTMARPAFGENRHGQIFALMVLTVINTVYLLVSGHYENVDELQLMVLLAINAVTLGYICTIPAASQEEEKKSHYRSLVSRFTMALMLIFVGSAMAGIIYIVMLASYHHVNFTDIQNQIQFGFMVVAIVFLVVMVIYLMLGSVEQNISLPLEQLSRKAREYVEQGTLAVEDSAADKAVADNIAAADNRPRLPWRNHKRDEIVYLDQSFYQMNQEIKQSVRKLVFESEKIHAQQAQIDVAREIQQGLMPNLEDINKWLEEKHPEYCLRGGMKIAQQIGGDMYDFYNLGDDYLVIMVADVSGDGVPAALYGALTQALLGNAFNRGADTMESLAEIISRVNKNLVSQSQGYTCVTMWVGVIRLSDGEVSYVNAGHNPALRMTREFIQAELLDRMSGPALGLTDDATYVSYKTTLPKGARIMLYTYGITAAKNEKNEPYGAERLVRAFSSSYRPEIVINDLKGFVGDAPISEDATILWVERNSI